MKTYGEKAAMRLYIAGDQVSNVVTCKMPMQALTTESKFTSPALSPKYKHCSSSSRAATQTHTHTAAVSERALQRSVLCVCQCV